MALEAYPNVAARAAAGGRPAILAEDRAQERNRRVREAKASSRMIVDRLYPEDDDTAFNEVSTFSTKELLTGIQELSKAQTTLKEETCKLSHSCHHVISDVQALTYHF